MRREKLKAELSNGLCPNFYPPFLKHRQEHQPVFNDNIPKQSREFALRDERMDSFVA
jgi:hypothetical protein